MLFTTKTSESRLVESPIQCNCLFCYKEVTLFFTGKNKQSPSITSLKKHRNNCHFGLYNQINFLHPTMGSLFGNDRSKLEEIFVMRDERKQVLLPPKEVKNIRPPKGKLTQECSEVIIDVDQDHNEERNRRVFNGVWENLSLFTNAFIAMSYYLFLLHGIPTI